MKKENVTEKELTVKQKRFSLITFIVGLVLSLVALAASLSFSAILWQANTTWISNLFSFFIFSFLFITYATPTAIISSVLSAFFLIRTASIRHGVIRKVCIVFIILDILFLITAILAAVQIL